MAMAGDGVNDASALTAAEKHRHGGTGSASAIETAAGTLLSDDLMGIVRVRRLPQTVMGNIRHNLFFASVCNAAGILIAPGMLYPIFGALLSPIIAADPMALSSGSVVVIALRLRSVRTD